MTAKMSSDNVLCQYSLEHTNKHEDTDFRQDPGITLELMSFEQNCFSDV